MRLYNNMNDNKLKILLFDYETSPAKGYFFGNIWETNIIEMIEYEQILSIAWKFYGDKTANVKGQDDFSGYKKGKLDDKKLVEYFIPIINSADIIIAHNGDSFDTRVFNTRLLAHGLDPISTEKTFDTKKIARNKFHLPSNKQDVIADFLKIPRKMAHKGKDMWLGCEAGKHEDWVMMKKYNKHDIIMLDLIVERLMPFMRQVNDYVITSQSGVTCPNATCLSKRMQKSKLRRVKDGFKQQYQCQDCGAYWTDTKRIH